MKQFRIRPVIRKDISYIVEQKGLIFWHIECNTYGSIAGTVKREIRFNSLKAAVDYIEIKYGSNANIRPYLV